LNLKLFFCFLFNLHFSKRSSSHKGHNSWPLIFNYLHVKYRNYKILKTFVNIHDPFLIRIKNNGVLLPRDYLFTLEEFTLFVTKSMWLGVTKCHLQLQSCLCNYLLTLNELWSSL
jgi:hypothetical protein